MKNGILVLMALLFALFFAGCSTNMGVFSVASTSNIPIQDTQKGDYVTGESCITSVFGISIGNTENRISVAMADALEKASKEQGFHADALTNVTIWQSDWTVILFGSDCMYVKGLPVLVGKSSSR